MTVTRDQKAMKLSLDHIQRLVADNTAPEITKIYGGMCHKLPVLIRTCGLCQTLAFMMDKASKPDDRGKAHQAMLNNIFDILHRHNFTLNGDNASKVNAVLQMPLEDYVYATRVLLDHCIYYKRFAVSILKVESAANEEDRNAHP